VTIRALAIPEPVPHGSGAASEACFAVTGRTRDLPVNALERIVRELHVVESLNLERVGDVTRITCMLGRGETKLPCVNVAVATLTLTWCPAVRGPFAAQPVLLRGAVATVAGGFRMSACQRPGGVIDPW
jgi:hypothetical protein